MKRETILLCSSLLAGCAALLALGSGPAAARPAPAKAAAKAPAKATAGGKVTGTITFQGKAPARKPLDRNTDPVCARTPRLGEDVVVTGGKLRDVHVRIASGTAGKHAAHAAPVVVSQLECMYTPRVVGVQEGQKLVVRNGDPTYHNVRGTKHEHTEWNLGQPPSAPDIVRESLGKAGEVVTLRCDVHPWMRAYAVVTDHPYFDVTGDDGSFTLDGVPPGRYTIEAWHPTLGSKRTEVTVHEGETANVALAFP